MGISQNEMSKVGRLFVVTAAVVIVLAAVKAASVILVPLFLAAFIAIIVQPLLAWFQQRGWPNWLAITAALVLIFIVGFVLSLLVVQSANDFMDSFPSYRERLIEHTQFVVQFMARFNFEISFEFVQSQFDPSRLMSIVMNMLSGLGGMMTNFFLVVLIVLFMLAEATSMPRKIALAFGRGDHQIESLRSLLRAVNNYLAVKTVISLMTGLLLGIALWLMDINHFVLWGLLAFLLNYIPNIGSILAAIPAILMALIQHHLPMAGAVTFVFVAVNLVMGNIIEPRVMGQRLGLSALVVLLSLLFWGWLLGPVGMLLSVPLTMMVKIALEENPDTRWLAILLGGEPAATEVVLLPVEPTHKLAKEKSHD